MLDTLPPRVRRTFRLAVRRREWTEADVDTELQLHLELRTEQLVAHGWTRADAEAEARRRFGPSWDDAVRHLHRSGQGREERLAMRERIDSFWQDVRYAARTLRRSPRYAIAAVVTLALGLGFTTVIFSLVDHIVLRPLPYAESGRLVVVREIVGSERETYPTMPVNASHFIEWKRTCGVCDGMAALRRASFTLAGSGDPQRLGGARVTANLFALLGARPALGRGFTADEEQVGRDHVVVLSDAFWRRQFGADPTIVGRTITLNDTPFEVVGVLPRGFTLPTGDELGALTGLPRNLDVYRPLALTERERITTGEFDYAAIARLRPGATPEQVRAQLDVVQEQFAKRPGGGSTLQTAVVPLQEQVVGVAQRPLLLLLAAVGAVLLIVCVNLTNLSLARSAARRHESAVRVALGAGAGRLARIALADSLTVAVIGGTLGLLLAYWGLKALIALAPATLPRVAEVQLDARVFGIATLLTLIVGIAVGALPAIRAGRAEPGEVLKAGGRSQTDGRAAGRRRAAFIGAQVAFSTVLLVGAGLFLASFVRVMRVDRGFETNRVLALDVVLPQAGYPNEERRTQFYDRAIAEVRGLPGVVGTAAVSALPLEGETWVNGIARAERMNEPGERPTANFRFVTPGYFTVVGTPLRAGRSFDVSDRTHRVVVISERTARTLWPGESPLGKQMKAGGDGTAEVIGIAADVKTSTLEKEGSLVVYVPAWEYPPPQGVIVVRTAGDPAALATSVRAALRRVDASVAVPNVRTMSQVVSSTVAARRFQLGLLGLFALMALVTASVGIYGVIAQSLASRTREFGVRMALGARSWDVHRLVLHEGLTPVAIGLAVGIAGSVAAGRGVESLLFGVHAGDPLTLIGVVMLLGMVALVACVVPARRVARTGVAEMLRVD